LEGDPALRYSTARELAAALRAGIAGREPPVPTADAPTRALADDATAATRSLPSRPPATPVARQAPVPRPAPRPRPAIQPAAKPRRSLARGLSSMAGILLVIASLAADIAAIVLLTTNAGQHTWPGSDSTTTVNDQVHAIQDFI